MPLTHKYCEVCGRASLVFYGHDEPVCEYCGNDEYFIIYKSKENKDEEKVIRKEFEENLAMNPHFDKAKAVKAKEMYDKKCEESHQRNMERIRRELARSPKPVNPFENKPKCPYCNSTNLSKISTANRLLSISLLGLGSSKIGKQWHCKDCNSDF